MIRNVMPVWFWITSACLSLALCLGLSAGFTVYWTQKELSSQCAALSYLIHDPQIPHKGFYNAIVQWSDGIRCQR